MAFFWPERSLVRISHLIKNQVKRMAHTTNSLEFLSFHTANSLRGQTVRFFSFGCLLLCFLYHSVGHLPIVRESKIASRADYNEAIINKKK